MLDRAQHLKLFLIGSGDSQKDADRIVSDKWVREALNQHPLNPKRLLWVMRRVSQFCVQEDEFLKLFGRYR
jgi:hypothetical protein